MNHVVGSYTGGVVGVGLGDAVVAGEVAGVGDADASGVAVGVGAGVELAVVRPGMRKAF